MSSRLARTENDYRITLVSGLIAVVLAGVVGGLVVFQPLAAVAVLGAVALLVFLRLADCLDRYFLAALGAILIGYAFFGRGFAYFGMNPVYIGEVVVGLAALSLFFNARRWRIGLVEALILLFMFLGVLATIPHLTTYGADALRDAAIWGYALVALAVAWLIRREDLETLSWWYALLIVPLVLWAPVVLAATAILGFEFPGYPWSGRPMIDVKPGDLAVHLAGIAAFVLTGLWVRRSGLSAIAEGLVWGIWFIGFVLAASWSRGGLLAASIGITAVLVLRPNVRMIVPVVSISLLIALFMLVDPSITVRADRVVSVEQITTNLRSIVGITESERLEGTREWRLNWWRQIIDYTVHGEYFWTGKGFGINLRVDDLSTHGTYSNLRSPHSSHMTVLARMGVPGAVAWISLQLAFAVTIVTSIYRSYGGSDRKLTAILIVVFVYWIAMVINSSFDVYFEGPQGGIWFWAIFGLGLAAVRFQREQGTSETNTSRPRPRTETTAHGEALALGHHIDRKPR